MSSTRRNFTRRSLALLSGLSSLSCLGPSHRTADSNQKEKTPVILDTDIGDDLDDTWALMMLLRTTGVDVKLITTDFCNTLYRTRLLAKLLEHMGRSDIPIGIGLEPTNKPGNQSEWLGDYQLENYPGIVHEDGVQALINTIKHSPVPITLLCIGPVTNIAAALRRDPKIARNARFVGMQGSIYKGYEGKSSADIEWNVKVDPASLQQVFAAPWQCTLTPLDTCGIVKLSGEKYQKIYHSEDSWIKVLLANYKIWLTHVTWLNPKPDLTQESSTLFDTVAVYLTHAEEYVEIEELPLRVTDAGYTIIDKVEGRPVRCAIRWKNINKFENDLINTITGKMT